MANTPTHPIYPYDGKLPKNNTGGKPMHKKVVLRIKVSSQTAYHLRDYAKAFGYNEDIGKALDHIIKAVRMAEKGKRE